MKAIPTEFVKYEPESDEERRGMQVLPAANLQFIQTQLAILMEERAIFTYDHLNFNESLQREAGLLGQIAAYRYLLTCHESALQEQQQQQINNFN